MTGKTMTVYTRKEVCQILASDFEDEDMASVFKAKSDYWLRYQFKRKGYKLSACADKFTISVM